MDCQREHKPAIEVTGLTFEEAATAFGAHVGQLPWLRKQYAAAMRGESLKTDTPAVSIPLTARLAATQSEGKLYSDSRSAGERVPVQDSVPEINVPGFAINNYRSNPQSTANNPFFIQLAPIVRVHQEGDLKKFIQRLPSGLETESVVIPMARRTRTWKTLCVS